MGKPVRVRFVGTKPVKVLMAKLEPGAQLKELRESLNLPINTHHIARAHTGEIIPDEADLYQTLNPGEELLASPRAELG